MAPRRLAALFLAIAVALVLPSISLAATSGAGLVPCGVITGNIDPSALTNVATQCEACNLVQLIQNVITFLIGLSVPIAMAMFAYAGFLYFTSGTGGSENISKAKSIFRNSLVGFALALCSWLIVNTILSTVISSQYFPGSTWFHVDCTVHSAPGTIGNVIDRHLGLAPQVTIVATTPGATADLTGCTTTGCTVSGTSESVAYSNPDGTQATKAGGSLAWRNNNPGNMRGGAGGITPLGYNDGFAVFATYQDGYNAMIANLQTQRYQSQTIAGAISIWAPQGDNNDPVAYANTITKLTGIPSSTPMNSLDSNQLNSMAQAIQTVEGYTPGQITNSGK